jgi:hypothetical protein
LSRGSIDSATECALLDMRDYPKAEPEWIGVIPAGFPPAERYELQTIQSPGDGLLISQPVPISYRGTSGPPKSNAAVPDR